MSCVIRISGDFEPLDLMKGSDMVAESMWRRGEVFRSGQAATDAGVIVVVSTADFSEFSQQVYDATEFVRRHQASLAEMTRWPGVERVVMDFGVAQRHQPSRTLSLPAGLAESAGRCGIDIDISLYEVSEE